MDPVGPLRNMRLPLRLATVFGAFGGFLYAYQNSSRKCKEQYINEKNIKGLKNKFLYSPFLGLD